jgi:hypothetical protein
MIRHLPLLLVTLVLLGLGLHELEQDRRIATLRADLERFRIAPADAVSAVPARVAGAYPAAAAPAGAARPELARPTPTPAATAQSARSAEPAPRAAVSNDEIARVESAVLSLLEADRPELREKLRAVVQEQQETLEHQQQEQRRERWIARTEARLGELSGQAALTDAQRQAILQLMLASRDQITDVMRSADTSEAFAAGRETVKRLRLETDAKIRELLSAAQYEAYKQALGDDDERGPGRRDERASPTPR